MRLRLNASWTQPGYIAGKCSNNCSYSTCINFTTFTILSRMLHDIDLRNYHETRPCGNLDISRWWWKCLSHKIKLLFSGFWCFEMKILLTFIDFTIGTRKFSAKGYKDSGQKNNSEVYLDVLKSLITEFPSKARASVRSLFVICFS